MFDRPYKHRQLARPLHYKVFVSYDDGGDYEKQHEAMMNWCRETFGARSIGNRWDTWGHQTGLTFWFDNEQDKMLFILKWLKS